MEEYEFWLKLTETPTGCWEWQGFRGKFGYGMFHPRGTNRCANKLWAHRVAYTFAVGPIPEGLIVRHKCDNPPCCNPDHLELGTYKLNAEDRKNRGRNAPKTGTLNGRAKVTPEQVRYIRSQRGIRKQQELADEFGITQNMVSKIQLRQFWQSVE